VGAGASLLALIIVLASIAFILVRRRRGAGGKSSRDRGDDDHDSVEVRGHTGDDEVNAESASRDTGEENGRLGIFLFEVHLFNFSHFLVDIFLLKSNSGLSLTLLTKIILFSPIFLYNIIIT